MSLFLSVRESSNSDSLLGHQVTIIFTAFFVQCFWGKWVCVCSSMCCVILVLLKIWINRRLHTFTSRGNAGFLRFCHFLSLTHPHPNTCNVRWCQTGIPHIAPDTPVFPWHFLCWTGTHRQPANLHSSPVDDLHLLKIAHVLSVFLSLFTLCVGFKGVLHVFVRLQTCVCICVGGVKMNDNCKGRRAVANLPYLLLPKNKGLCLCLFFI